MHKIKILHLLNLEKFSSTTVIGLDFKILILHHFHDLGKIGNSSLAQYSKFPVFILLCNGKNIEVEPKTKCSLGPKFKNPSSKL